MINNSPKEIYVKSFYCQQVIKLREEVLPDDYLLTQAIQAKKFIDLNYANHITLNDIASEAAFSKFHFIRLFKKVYGKTPHQYLIAVRVEKAKQFLKTGLPISEVCFSVGFDSTGSFTTLFKKFTGLTPSNFQKKLRS